MYVTKTAKLTRGLKTILSVLVTLIFCTCQVDIIKYASDNAVSINACPDIYFPISLRPLDGPMWIYSPPLSQILFIDEPFLS